MLENTIVLHLVIPKTRPLLASEVQKQNDLALCCIIPQDQRLSTSSNSTYCNE